MPWAREIWKERSREGSWQVRTKLRLHVEHVGRALVVPVPEAGVVWALQLQDILFPEGQREKEEEVEERGDRREEGREDGALPSGGCQEKGKKEGEWSPGWGSLGAGAGLWLEREVGHERARHVLLP